MKNFTIFGTLIDKNKISKLLDNEKINFNVMSLNDNNKVFLNMREKIYDYFNNIKSNNIKIKENLLKKIQTIESIYGIVLNTDLTEDIFNKLLHITNLSNGMLFVDNSMMLNSDGLLILDIDGNSEINEFTISNDASKIAEKTIKNKDSMAVNSNKTNSATINENNIHKIQKKDNDIRNKEEICKRFISTTLIAAFADGLYNEIAFDKISGIIAKYIQKYNATKFFTPLELNYLKNPDSLETKNLKNIILNFESASVLLFTLGGIKKLDFPDNFYNKDILINQLFNFRNFDYLTEKTAVIKPSELNTYIDNYINFYKSLKDNTNKNTTINKDIVIQRLKSFLWIAKYNGSTWDNVNIE
jgi:hypothetical protein